MLLYRHIASFIKVREWQTHQKNLDKRKNTHTQNLQNRS